MDKNNIFLLLEIMHMHLFNVESITYIYYVHFDIYIEWFLFAWEEKCKEYIDVENIFIFEF